MKKHPQFRKLLAILLAALTVMSSLVILPITASATNSVCLDISTENQKLRVRLKLSDPFGFMAITSLSMDGQTVAMDDYAAHGVTEVGFQFLKSEAKKDTAAILADANTVKATGAKYDAENFYAVYEELYASELHHTVYFIAYAVVGGQTYTSDARSLKPYPLIAAGAKGEILGQVIESVEEKNCYATMLDYFLAYRQYLGTSLNVGTYNINFGQDNSVEGKPHNLQNIVNVIKNNDLGVVALQEVNIYSSHAKSGGLHTPYEIAKMLTEQTGEQYYWAFAAGLEGHSARPYQNAYSQSNPGPSGWSTEGQGPAWNTVSQSGYGNAIISKYPILSVREIKMMAPGQTQQLETINNRTYERRALLIAEIDVDGVPLTVMATHMDLPYVAINASVSTILQEIKNISTPVILMGDLNCLVGETPINSLESGGFTLIGDQTATHQNGKLDHILYTGATVTDVLYRVLTDNAVSDHYPALATFTIIPK